MPDTELTNYKSGIDIHYGDSATTATDKGVGYMEEYLFHNKVAYDYSRVVYIKSDVEISMSHNDRNVAAGTDGNLPGGRGRYFVEPGDPSGEGVIRYRVGEIWRKDKYWAGSFGTNHTAYTAPFALDDITYPSGDLVATKTGGRAGYTSVDAEWWSYGLVDSVGDIYVILMAADDDTAFPADPDSEASDGIYRILCVNPKTPAMTVRASGAGQFYTTPAWTYWVPKIHDQTTYFQGTVTFELRDINGGNVFYRINGGSFTDAGTNHVTLDQDDFSTGSNTLEYYYAGNSAFTKTRTVVKNPGFPSAGETHGDRMWGASNWTKFLERYNRLPYTQVNQTAPTHDATWDGLKNTGLLWGNTTYGPHPGAMKQAIKGRLSGMDVVPSGSTLTYAACCKERMLDTILNSPTVGFEITIWQGDALPCSNYVYRGYWDVYGVTDAAIVYDIMCEYGRSDQVAGGMTPVEDYYMRDMLASWVHTCLLALGSFAANGRGLWTVSRHVGAQAIAAIIPEYSTPYYGTSGMDGVTTSVYQWAPFQTSNYTWKRYFYDQDYTLTSYPLGPVYVFGMESVGSGVPPEEGLIRLNSWWGNKASYSTLAQTGSHIYIYANLLDLHGDVNTGHDVLLDYLTAIAGGTAYVTQTADGYTAGVTQLQRSPIYCLHQSFPDAAEAGTLLMQGLASSNIESETEALRTGGMLAIMWYDDNYYGGAISSRPVADPLPRIFENPGEIPIEVTFTCETVGAVLYIETAAGTDLNAVADPDNTSTVCDGTEEFAVTTAFKIVAQTSGGGYSPVLSGVYQVGTLNRPVPPINQSATPI